MRYLYSARLKIQLWIANILRIGSYSERLPIPGYRRPRRVRIQTRKIAIPQLRDECLAAVFSRSSFRRYLYRPSVGPKKFNPQYYSSKVEFSTAQSIIEKYTVKPGKQEHIQHPGSWLYIIMRSMGNMGSMGSVGLPSWTDGAATSHLFYCCASQPLCCWTVLMNASIFSSGTSPSTE